MTLSSSDLEFFAIVARAGSLAAAARTLDVTLSAVSQRLKQLELRLGVRLVTRSARRLTLTDEGQLLAHRGQALVDELDALAESISARRGVVSGHLRVIAPLGFGRAHVGEAVASFAESHPEISLDLHVSDRLGRVPEEAWDVAVHIGVLHDSAMVAQPLAPNDRFVCASPSYVERFGAPSTPADLPNFSCMALRENDEDVTMWRFTSPDGAVAGLRIEPLLATNDGDILRDWAIAGRGIMVRSEWSVADDLRAGRLVRLLAEYALPSADVVALVAPRRGRSARTARFLEHLRERLTPAPWRRP
ncbi:MAG: LysR substrate-binding domain-containing protein [Gemmatimonadaceae bacterium]